MSVQNKPFVGSPAFSDAVLSKIKVATAFTAGAYLKANGDGTFSEATLTDAAYAVAGIETMTNADGLFQTAIVGGHCYADDPATLVGVTKIKAQQCLSPTSGAEVAKFLVKLG